MSKATDYLVEQIRQRDETIGAMMRANQGVWDEGWHAHFLEWDAQRKDPSHPITKNNPYQWVDVKP